MAKTFTMITGATGFIGSHVVERILLDGEFGIIAIVRGGKGYKNVEELGKKGAVLVRGSFYDKDLIDKVFREFPIQNVIHIAALTGEGAGTKRDYYDVNVRGTEALLSAAHRHRVEKFIFCSSVGVFGTIPVELPANLKTKVNADNTYHRSKLEAEERVYDFIGRGLDAFIIRPTITYGKRDNGFPSTLIKMVRKRILLLPLRDNMIHLLAVSSLADMFLRLLKAGNIQNRVFIAGDEGPVVLRELVDLIHSFYFGKDYPCFLKMPNIFFYAFSMVFQAVNNSRWRGRVQLLSQDWYYEPTETNSLIGFQLANTKKEFLRYLQSLR